MEVLKQPWLTQDELHEGKPRFVEIMLQNKENIQKNLKYDRKQTWKSEIVQDDSTITTDNITKEIGDESQKENSDESSKENVKIVNRWVQKCMWLASFKLQ